MSAEAVVPESYYTPISYLSSSARSMRIVKNGADVSRPAMSLTKELLSMRDGVRVCSRLHALVYEFLSAHGVASTDVVKRRELAERYPIAHVSIDQVPAIKRLSTPAAYAELRHGGRLLSPYPPLGADELQMVCDEIRAALVWKATEDRD